MIPIFDHSDPWFSVSGMVISPTAENAYRGQRTSPLTKISDT
jgi:hypothetical protein